MENQTKPQITFFNRHENMDSETRHMILDTISDLHQCPLGPSAFTMENWLYGAFDGYDYSDVAIFSHELASITHVDSELGGKISEIFAIIEKYPRTTNPNNNNF
jgi:hypothetical protein